MSAPRVRFAPSPTGFLHVGGARTALFNWLFARHTGGTFVLRIEDTDTERTREEWVTGIQSTLRWLGIDWDEGPFRQSERAAVYAEAAERLVASGHAYRCDCTPEQIKERTKANATPGYDGYCRDRNVAAGEGVSVRFRTPDEGTVTFTDVIRGEITERNETVEDFVIVRSTGHPTFYLANAVDDIDMGITHIIRGEDLTSSTRRVLLLREALGATERPVFAHLPLLVGQDRQKLSKRHGDIALEDYRDKGYLPEALRNYLVLLGWAPRDGREIVPIDDVVAEFALEDVTKAAAFFDHQKLDHINGEYIRALPADTFVRESLPWLETDPPWPPERFDLAVFQRVAPLVQERVKTLAEVPAMVDFLFVEEPVMDERSWDKAMKPPAADVLADAIAEYETCEWNRDVLHAVTLAIGERHGLKLAKAQAPIRVAVTGRTVGPPLFESLEVLGRDPVLRRLRVASARLG
ncbi:MAG: glutamyl-tRNA synthetase [Acidimicrobiales bacterium]|nr:glutamyl-tRNA synthetase [Acidimicrobiales bacterium]